MKLKNLTKIISIIMIIAILLQNTIVLANVISIGEIKYVERADKGFYSIQHWNEEKGIWQYVTYSRTYYTDDNGQKRIAYCILPDYLGVGWISGEHEGYDTTVKEKLSDNKLWRVYKNGFPYVSPSELGVETEDDVYDEYRAGEVSIDGEDLDEIQRRGKKVVDAIYNLVNIGLNGTETMNGINIVKKGDLVKEQNLSNYSSQKYLLNNSSDTSITVKEILNAPEGTFIADCNGNKRNTFKGGEEFKVFIPRNKIDKDYNIKINYSSICKNYPVFIANSNIEDTQNYLLTAEKYDDENGSLDCLVDSKISSFEIIKKDSDTKEPIPGVEFNVKYEDGEEIGNYTTDENGRVNLTKLHPGRIEIKEVNTNDEAYIIDGSSSVHKIEYDSSYGITIYNKARRGELEIFKVDKDNNEFQLSDVEFEIIDKNGNVVTSKKTDGDGKIVVENLKIGDYVVREVNGPEEYVLDYEESIHINENETLNLKIENEKKKGEIKVIKVDKENNKIRIPNVEFEIINSEGDVVDKISTDVNGEAYTKRLPIGDYTIKEIKTGEKYLLNENNYEVEIKENETSEITIENERKKGKIKIIKVSKDDNKLNDDIKGDPIENVKFEIYSQDGFLIDTLVTDVDGIAISKDLDKGKYIIKEVEPGEYYVLNDETFEVLVENNGEIVEITIENEPANPETEIIKNGPQKANSGEEIKYEFDIYNTGNTDLERFTWYDFLPYEKARITKFSTGTYNQDLIYNIYYKTNKSNEFAILREGLNTSQNYYIDLSRIGLEEDEIITEIKAEFGSVKVGFGSLNSPFMLLKLNNDLENNEEVENETILDSYYQNYKISSEDKVVTVIINEEKKVKRLPRTGF